MTEKRLKKFHESMASMKKLISKSSAEEASLLRSLAANTGLLDAVLALLLQPLKLASDKKDGGNGDKNESKDDPTRQVSLACLEWLRFFVSGSPQSQAKLFKRFPELVALLEQNMKDGVMAVAVAQTALEIVRDNMDLCLAMHQDLVAPFVNATYQQNESHVFLRFLEAIQMPGGEIIMDNQNMVMRLLVENHGLNTLLLPQETLSGEALKRHRSYLAHFLSLIGICTAGENFYTETMCQKMLSVEVP